MELLLSACLGFGLSAACFFRVFVPLLVAGVASRAGYVTLSSGFDWIGSTPALTALAVATALEIIAYHVPWLDHLLDFAATPAAVVAGVAASASVLTVPDPWVRWSLAVIAGGGVAGSVQVLTVAARHLSTIGTGGLGNPVVAAFEATAAIVLSVMAVLAPVAAVLAIVVLAALATRRILRRRPATIS
jgi:hypothetical protein